MHPLDDEHEQREMRANPVLRVARKRALMNKMKVPAYKRVSKKMLNRDEEGRKIPDADRNRDD